ncbi:hypothetical protein BDK51DRAFT_23171 [Blyttiomyces helicus]|uniref:GST N-terminal domain-containing protein n=1 Tax=Blyttiomyces helicus TaxID=388810 RepID=A0A4P9WHG3_9FUNG|nr:hypothetical protein BDK51DRAFT_23171 [Blyttiomyces helicus]|eukprot:RKO92271.1 hypothetical protein BDK51DRAFT_23171 [Blyttiomyces helicus]
MSDAKQVIFYDLCGDPGKGPIFSPNTWKTRMALLHKKVDFCVVELSFGDITSEAFKKKTGMARPFVPLIELPDGTLISDSFHIAEYLETAYPNAPSLFLPTAPLPSPPPTSPAFQTAHQFACLIDAGLGSSDARWSTFFELAGPAIARQIVNDADRAYFFSDAKMGIVDGWKKLVVDADRADQLARARSSLYPIARLLSRPFFAASAAQLALSPAHPTPLFLASSTAPGLVDYILFGRYVMCAAVDPALAESIFKNAHGDQEGNVWPWVERVSLLVRRGGGWSA